MNSSPELFSHCQKMVFWFYRLTAVVALLSITMSAGFWVRGEVFTPLWPVAWLILLPPLPGLVIVLALSITGITAGAIHPKKSWARLSSFTGLLLLAALASSFGQIRHLWHTWLATSFVLAWLPETDDEQPETHECYILICWGAIMLVLWTYTLAGLWKIVFGLGQWYAGEIHFLHQDALAIQVADQLSKKGGEGWVTVFFMEHRYLGTFLYAGAVLLELFSVAVAFKPRYQEFWGVCLIAMHIGIFLIWTSFSGKPRYCADYSWFALHLPGVRIGITPRGIEMVYDHPPQRALVNDSATFRVMTFVAGTSKDETWGRVHTRQRRTKIMATPRRMVRASADARSLL
jgi:hypothetical protein